LRKRDDDHNDIEGQNPGDMERVESQEHEDGASGESLDQPAEEEVCAICLDELFELTVIKIKCLMI
jgi:hypothetical protein